MCPDLATVEEVWKPLLRPAFLEGLWLKLTRSWRQAGFYPAAADADALQQLLGNAAAGQLLSGYIYSGAFPSSLQNPSMQVRGCAHSTKQASSDLLELQADCFVVYGFSIYRIWPGT